MSQIDAAAGIRSIGFGPGNWTGIVADLDGEHVGHIWCAGIGDTADNKIMMADMLCALSTDHHLMLLNWESSELVDLRVRDDIESYLDFPD